MKIKELLRREGFRWFLTRLAIFIGIFLVLPVLMYPFLELSRFPEAFPKFMLVDVGEACVFMAIAFIFLAREKLFEIKKHSYQWKNGVVFGLLTLASAALYLYSRYVIKTNFDYWINEGYYLGLMFNLIPILLMVLFLGIAVFGLRFAKSFIKEFKNEIISSFILSVIAYVVIILIRSSWKYLGYIVSHSVAFLLSLSYDDVVLRVREGGYDLGADNFVASIGDLCSGIDSMTLYIGLFMLILFYDWKVLDKKKMAILFIPGLIGLIGVNIFRIYLLYIVGILISPEFAVGMFHSNIGMILFIAYFIVFWWIFYKWVKK